MNNFLSPPDYERPIESVEIESGREAVRLVRLYTAEFRDEYLAHLPLGPATGEYLKRILDVLIEDPNRIDANGGVVTHYYSFNAMNRVPIDEESDARLTVGVRNLENRVRDLQRLTGWTMSEHETREFTYRWLTWHELGHAVQSAFENVAPRKKIGNSFFAQDLVATTCRELVDYGVDSDTTDFSMTGIRAVESERFAEGFARMLLQDWLLKEFDPETAQLVLDSMTKIRNINAADAVVAFDEYLGSGSALSVDKYFKERGITGSSNHVGYGRPHDQDTVLDILSATKEWEVRDPGAYEIS